MILFKSDWYKNPTVIPDFKTNNKSFLKMAKVLSDMKIDNHLFFLALHNPELSGVDPFDENLTEIQKVMIGEEVADNPWYYIRECVRIPAKSGIDDSPFILNRGILALFWLFFSSIPLLLIMPRQTGKSVGTNVLFRGLLNFWTENNDINLITKDIKLRTTTVESLKDIDMLLPPYLRMTTKKDMDNKEGISVKHLNNYYKTQIGQMSLAAALNAARGLTSATFQIDEFGYIYNIENMLAPALAAGAKARDNARKSNMPYGTVFTTTSARLDIASGRFAYGVYLNGAEFVDKLYDIPNKHKLENYTRKHTRNGEAPIMIIEFNHRQLGYTDKWLVKTMEESRSTGLDAEADFFNKWPDGGSASPLDKKYLDIIDDSEREVVHLGLSGDGYAIRWYVSEEMVNNILINRELIMGMDTSEAIGGDDIAFVIRDVKTGEVCGVGQYNELNTTHFGQWIGSLLIKFKKMVMIIEKRSTGISIIDTVIIMLLDANIDPFKKLFNWLVDEMEFKPIQFEKIKDGINNRARRVYDLERKQIGFATSGGGRTSRSGLFGETFLDSVKLTGGVVKDKKLIKQIKGLREKNGKIDHMSGEHDDLVIGWLLSYWFLSKARHTEFYDLTKRDFLVDVVNNSTTVGDDIKEKDYLLKQRGIKREITHFLEILRNGRINSILRQKIEHKVKVLYTTVDSKVITVVNMENALDEIMSNRSMTTKKIFKRRQLPMMNNY